MRYYPIVSLDKVYLNKCGIIYLDCTRLERSNTLVSRINPNNFSSVKNQIKRISKYLFSIKQTKIVLVDDVVFSGNVLRSVIDIFKLYGIDVIGIKSIISTQEGYDYFKSNLLLGLDCEIIIGNDVIDQICERDFYYGIAQSGISINKDNIIYKSPYFLPFGNPFERASIPKKYEKYFSKSCIERSIEIWNEIQQLSNKVVLNKELPEIIYKTNVEEEVLKTLKKEL